MKKLDELVDYLQDKNLVSNDIISKYCARCDLKKENEKKGNTVLWVLAIIGAVAAVAAIAYAVYRYMTPDYLDDFDDEFDDDLRMTSLMTRKTRSRNLQRKMSTQL